MAKASNAKLEKQILDLEKKIGALRRKALALRQKAGKLDVEDYVFQDWEDHPVRLSELFGGKEDLIVVHNMGRQCPHCTLWADGFNGVLSHLESRAAFAVVSPDEARMQKEFARFRGWRFRMLSSKGTSFTEDMGFRKKGGAHGGYQPGVSVFQKKKDGKIHRVSMARFGPGDDFCAVWHLLDLLAGGAKGWVPKFQYGVGQRPDPRLVSA